MRREKKWKKDGRIDRQGEGKKEENNEGERGRGRGEKDVIQYPTDNYVTVSPYQY